MSGELAWGFELLHELERRGLGRRPEAHQILIPKWRLIMSQFGFLGRMCMLPVHAHAHAYMHMRVHMLPVYMCVCMCVCVCVHVYMVRVHVRVRVRTHVHVRMQAYPVYHSLLKACVAAGEAGEAAKVQVAITDALCAHTLSTEHKVV